jgi:WD40 repeat protein
VVTRPARPQLLETLTRPAALFGHVFEDGLAEEMVETVADEPAALALLQFCADQLWNKRESDTLRLTRAAYGAVNGVEGAMASHADRVFDALSTAQRVEGRRLLQRLVTPKLTKEPRRRDDLLESAPDQERARFVLHQLTDARLLRVYQADDGSPMVEVAHEALLRHWQRVEDWLGEDENDQRMLRSLGHAARLWESAGRASDLLWRGDTLLGYGLWRQGSDAVLTTLEAAFAEASQGAWRRARGQRRAAFGIVVAAVAAVAVGATWLWLGAEKARGEAVSANEASMRSLAQAEAGALINAARLAEAGGESATALRLGVEAYERAPDVSRAREALYQLLLSRREGLLLQTDLDAVGWTVPPWSPDGTRFVVGRGDEVSLLDEAGTPVTVLDGEPGWFAKVVWRPDSRAFATFEGGIRIWGADGELLGGPLSVEGVPAWTPDGSELLVRSWSRSERTGWLSIVSPAGDIAGEVGRGATPIWERSGSPTDSRILLTRATGVFLHARSGELLVEHRQDGCQPVSARWHPDGTRVGALWGCESGPGFVAAFSSTTGEEQQRWPSPPASAQIEWSPTGQHLLVVGEEEFAIRGSDGGTYSLPRYCGPTVASWSPDGERVLVPCFRGDAFIYARSGEQLAAVGENRQDMKTADVPQTMRVASWLGDGALVATQDATNTIATWAADGSSARGPSAETGRVLECSWHPAGELFATTARDGTVRVWDRDGALRARIGEPWASPPRGFPADVMPRIAWDPTAPRLVVGRADDAVRIWAHDGPEVPLADDPGSIGLLAWSPDGAKIALVSGNQAAVFAPDGATRYRLELERRVEYISGSFGAGWNAASTHLIMAGHTGAPVLWDAQGHRTDLIWNGSGGLDWHPSGDRFYISDGFRADAPISRVYDLEGEVLNERPGVIRSTWDPRGELWIFTTRAGDVLARENDTVVAPLPYRSRMRVISWSPGGSWFLGLVYGDAGVLWGRDGERRAVLQLQGEDGAVCFDPEEELLSVGVGSDVMHLPLDDEALLARVRSIAPQPFAAADTAQYLH